MSSHREAPSISKDPAADNTDVYAFVSPDDDSTVTLIANYLPFEAPFGGPNFFEFAGEVQYDINIDQNGDGTPDVTYRFTFEVEVGNRSTFLYNTGPIDTIDSPNWNRKQFYSVQRIDRHGTVKALGTHLACPPCNIGPGSTPDYADLAAAAVHSLPGGRTVFAGQRAEAFYVDLGSIFDLADLRPFQNANMFNGMPAHPGVNSTFDFSVHTIALKVPKTDLTVGGAAPTDPMARSSVVGVWATASRRKSLILEPDGKRTATGPFVQISRLGNPLFNEVIVPMIEKNRWNSLTPAGDSEFRKYVRHPELAGLLPGLYPGVFPNLDALNKSGKPRLDLDAVLLTGLPSGIVPGFQNNTGTTPADELRLNMAIPPSKTPSIYGLLGGDPAGYPNGRRVADDVTAIELRAIVGVTYALVDKTYTPDAAAGAVTDGLTPADAPPTLDHFPYLGTPQSGYDTAPLSKVA